MGHLLKEVYPFSNDSIQIICDKLSQVPIRQKQLVQYINCPVAFDIETSTVWDNDEPHSFMYIWQFGINIDNTNYIIYGRTWIEFKCLLDRIVRDLYLNKGKRLIIFIHNLSYEFSFIAKRFDWAKVFSIDRRKPLFSRTVDGIEFRCSYMLTGLSLNNLAKSLTRYKCKKQVGSLDYDLIRGSNTPLDNKELLYCIDDIHVLLSAIKERIEDAKGTITKLPYTKTGYVRNFCRDQCFGTNHKEKQYKLYRNYVESLTLDSDFYDMCKWAFAGGFTHANAYYVDKNMYHVGAMDISSSYPATMMLPVFPISSFTQYTDEINDRKTFDDLLKKHCCIFEIGFYGIDASVTYENYISVSKCRVKENFIENNGRLVSADFILLTITEIDFDIIQHCYKWEKMRIGKMMIADRGYLPKSFILAILSMYENKTKLKGIEDQKAFYQNQKEMLNSSYGMTVQDAVQELVTFDLENGWDVEITDKESAIIKYNNDKQRFLYYPWGLYVTAESRKHLWYGIHHLKQDYIYTDTDSLKFRNPENHFEWFENYNKALIQRLYAMCDHYHIDRSLIHPKDKKGKDQFIGIWDYEGTYKIFRTLGAKRYLYMDEKGHNQSTVAGVRKQAIDYLNRTYGRYGIFEHFTSGIVIPANESGKTESIYNDNEIEGDCYDYLGNKVHYHELTSVSIKPTEYSMNRSTKFIEYLLNIRRFKNASTQED